MAHIGISARHADGVIATPGIAELAMANAPHAELEVLMRQTPRRQQAFELALLANLLEESVVTGAANRHDVDPVETSVHIVRELRYSVMTDRVWLATLELPAGVANVTRASQMLIRVVAARYNFSADTCHAYRWGTDGSALAWRIIPVPESTVAAPSAELRWPM